MSRAWPGTGYVVAIGIGLVLGVLSAWFDSLPIDTISLGLGIIGLGALRVAMLAIRGVLFGQPG